MNDKELMFIVSRYKEDVNWIKEYTDNYIILNKGETLGNTIKEKMLENIGGNQRDIFYYIFENYENLPELMLFIQAYPFDHCKKEKFDILIKQNKFASVEAYEHIPECSAHKKDKNDGGYTEINNSWYINAHNNHIHDFSCKYSSYDQFMNSIFKNYTHVPWIRFAPGSQYIIEKKQALNYSKKFWGHLMNILNRNNMTEAHILERACYYIINGIYEPIDSFK